jgi:hypothetical protein
MLMLPPLHLFIKQEARQAANRLLGNRCSYVLNFGYSELLIKMTDEMALLLAPRDKFVTLNIFDRRFFVDFSKDMLFWRVWNIAFWRALSTEQYQSALIVGLCGNSL